MPTPFYHLSIAQDLLAHPELPPTLGVLLHEQSSAFLFGNTAPDVQVISGQSREETHFFDASAPDDGRVYLQILSVYPHYRYPARLPAAQAAFLGGYLCHLLADWIWLQEIFIPFFGPGGRWKERRERHFHHNILRTYLDGQILPSLTNGVRTRLKEARPHGWLAFVPDEPLCRWRDLLAEQLLPGAAIRTVEVFSARQGLPPEVYYDLLESEERLEAELFAFVPRQVLASYRSRILKESLALLEAYFLKQAQPVSDRS